MPNPPNKTVYHLVLPREEKEKFERLYPRLISYFLNRCIHLANNNKDLFEKIFFSEVK